MAGGTGAGPHMWNIMHMENGKNYLVDVTNCDGKSVGSPDKLFLVGISSGNVRGGYYFKAGSNNILYQYDSQCLSDYSTEELTISDSNYINHDFSSYTNETLIYEWVDPVPADEDAIVLKVYADCADCHKRICIESLRYYYTGLVEIEPTCESEGRIRGNGAYVGPINPLGKGTSVTKVIPNITMSPLGHIWSDWTIEGGNKKRTCQRSGCGQVEYEYIKEDPICIAPSNIKATYGQKLGNVIISNPAGNTSGTWSWNEPDTYVGKPGDTNQYLATFTPTNTTKYNVKKNIPISINVGFLVASPSYKYNGSTGKKTWFTRTYGNISISADNFTVSDSLDGPFNSSYTIVRTADGEVSKYLYFKNSRGLITDKKEIKIQYDWTAPSFEGTGNGIIVGDDSWKSLSSKITYNNFYKSPIQVKVNSSELVSGVRAYYYYVDKTGSTTALTTAELNEKKSSFNMISAGTGDTVLDTIAMDGKYLYYVYAVDKAGNESDYICSGGLVCDSTPPVVDIPIFTDTVTDTSAVITAVATDAESGIKSDYYIVYGTQDTSYVTKDNIKLNETGVHGSNIQGVQKDGVFTLNGLLPNTKYYFAIGVADNVGNMTVRTGDFVTHKATLEIRNVPSITGTYGDSLRDMTLSKTRDSINGVEGTWSISQANSDKYYPVVNGAEGYQITFTPDSDAYNVITKRVIPVVSPKPITLKIKNADRNFGEDNLAFSIDIASVGTQLVRTDTLEGLRIVFNCSANSASDVVAEGYPITAVAGNANYNVTFINGKLTINKVDFAGEKTVSCDLDRIVGGSAEVILPAIPAGATLGEINNDGNEELFNAAVVDGKLKLTSEGIVSEENRTLTIAVNNATNYNNYFITVTVRPVDHVHARDMNRFHAEVPATKVSDGTNAYYECANGCDKKLKEDDSEYTEEELIIPRLDIIISFDANEGNVSTSSKEVKYEAAFGELPIPTRDNYIFDGWFTEKKAGTKVNSTDAVSFEEDTILYAHWTGVSKTITFNYAGVAAITIPYGSSFDKEGIILPEPEGDEEHVFLGWFLDDPEIENAREFMSDTEVKEDITLFPAWEISGVYITLEADEYDYDGKAKYDYTGKAIKPNVKSVMVDGNILKQGQDYTVSYKNNIKAFEELDAEESLLQKSAPTVVITGKGNYAGVYREYFKITRKSLKDEDVTVGDVAAVLSTGKEIKPVPVVTWGKTKLANNRDFTVSYYSDETCTVPAIPKDAGTYYVRVEAKDGSNYTDKANPVVFLVGRGKGSELGEQKLISKLSIKAPKTKNYNNGADLKLSAEELEVKDGARKTLKSGVDYITEYSDNTCDIGTVTVTIKANSDEYVGSKKITYQIVGTPLTKAKMNGFKASLPYADGNDVEQHVSFTLKDDPLLGISVAEYNDISDIDVKRTVDYTYEYVNNKEIGKATVIYRGVNAYSGEIKKQFSIIGNAISAVKIQDGTYVTSFIYDEKECLQSDMILVYTDKEGNESQVKWIAAENFESMDDSAEKRSIGCMVSYQKNTNAGTATIILTGVNKYSGVQKKTFKIQPFDIAENAGNKISVAIQSTSYSYDKSGVMPEPVVKFGETVLVKDKDYTVTWLNNKNINDGTGKNKPTVKITGKGNFKGVNDKLTFTIGVRDLQTEGIKIDAKDKVYANKAGNWKTTVSVYDGTKKLAVNADYSKIEYYYDDIPEGAVVHDGADKSSPVVSRKNGDKVGDKDIVPAGTIILVKVVGDGKNGNYINFRSEKYAIAQADINSLRLDTITKTYTGKQIRLTTADFKWYQKLTKLDDVTFEIDGTSYSNNIKKGNATVVVRGTGNYCGTKKIIYIIKVRNLFE